VSVNKAIDAWAMVPADAQQQGLVARNGAERITHVASRHKVIDMRREVSGLRWADVNLKAKL